MDIKKIIFYDCRIGWGLSLIFFGILFTLYHFGVGDSWFSWLFNPKNYPIYAGIIFFFTHNYIMSAVWFLLAAILRIGLIVYAAQNYKELVIPFIFIVAGLLLIAFTKNGRR